MENSNKNNLIAETDKQKLGIIHFCNIKFDNNDYFSST